MPRSVVAPSAAVNVNSSARLSPIVSSRDASAFAISETTCPSVALTRRAAAGVSCVWYTSTKCALSGAMLQDGDRGGCSGREPRLGMQLPTVW